MSFLSLLGLPPLSGFVGKLEVSIAAIDAGQAWLAVIAVLNTVVSLFYYLRIIAPAVRSPAAEDAGQPRAATPAPARRPGGRDHRHGRLRRRGRALLDLASGAELMGAR